MVRARHGSPGIAVVSLCVRGLALVVGGCGRDWDQFYDAGRRDGAARDDAAREGFPTEDSTGVPPGATLAPRTGTLDTSAFGPAGDAPGFACVVQDIELAGELRVDCDGTLIRRVRVRAQNLEAVANVGGARYQIEDSEIDCAEGSSIGLRSENYTAARVQLRGCAIGFDIAGTVTARENWLAVGNGTRIAASASAAVVTLEHNTIDTSRATTGRGESGNGALFFAGGTLGQVTATNNLLAGGDYTIYVDAPLRLTMVDNRVVENEWTYNSRTVARATVDAWRDNLVVRRSGASLTVVGEVPAP